jgi:hypothetical protein
MIRTEKVETPDAVVYLNPDVGNAAVHYRDGTTVDGLAVEVFAPEPAVYNPADAYGEQLSEWRERAADEALDFASQELAGE